ncbi:NUDIX domain-containing protein [Sphingomonas adhaesiva]|uniref:NUDIX domain-containing protein n=1 Tax=Sphingomonas adhaesiva TaxID=28212 RepID=UPI002FF62AC6
MAIPRPILSLIHPLRSHAMALLRWRTRGVKVMVFDAAGRVLLVRHGYGRSDLFMLPGGGVGRGETPHDAAIRELAEEVACRLEQVTAVACYESRSEGRRDTVHLFTARTADTPMPDAREIIEARFVAPEALPDSTSVATRRRIEEWRGERVRSTAW